MIAMSQLARSQYRTAIVLDHTKDPCSKSFIPDTTVSTAPSPQLMIMTILSC